MRYRAISRWKELYFPSAINLQIWLALLAFSMFLFVTVVWGWEMVTTYACGLLPSILVTIFLCAIGGISLLFVIFAFSSLFCITVRAIRGVKIKPEEHKETDIRFIGGIDRKGRLFVSKREVRNLVREIVGTLQKRKRKAKD